MREGADNGDGAPHARERVATWAGSSSDENEPLDGTLVVGPPTIDPGCDEPAEGASDSSSSLVDPNAESMDAEGGCRMVRR